MNPIVFYGSWSWEAQDAFVHLEDYYPWKPGNVNEMRANYPRSMRLAWQALS